ncbi:MAG: RloB family protein [Lachnospiraceae bacterium]|nr:RloB family protein [Lachnospiraceae bacterium]
MARTRLSAQRLAGIKKMNIGHIIIFCEGKSEKYYFEYFAEILKKNKYTDIEVILEDANGNARTVLNCANNFMLNDRNNQKYSSYGKYLAFDCDDPPNIQSVIQDANGKYELLISNYLFETWLLMHFEDMEEKISKSEIYRKLGFYLHGDYSKGDKGKTREIIQNGDVEKAIDNAKKLEEQYNAAGKGILTDIQEMNPYTSVYRMVEQFMAEISDQEQYR